MCGRYSMPLSLVELARLLEAQYIKPQSSFKVGYNIAPSREAPLMTLEQGRRVLKPAHWGLSVGQGVKQCINLRAEKLSGKSFSSRNPAARPCVAPAQGFYEWEKSGQAHYFYFKSAALLCMAALCWPRADGVLGFAIITTRMPDAWTHIHERSPLLLAPDALNDWLSRDSGGDWPFAPEPIASHPVSRAVNKPDFDSPDCIARSLEPVQAQLF
ncbi:MAG: hypothetical protein A2X49_05125 [Lentisphaerae bacterium GWF2_52_8]|nr:MAG: hypothetical protein A2X49_05125 [Lentisphaerae bacterium GWF2_52_8]